MYENVGFKKANKLFVRLLKCKNERQIFVNKTYAKAAGDFASLNFAVYIHPVSPITRHA